MGYDGEIRFNTRIDNSNVQKDLNRIENDIRKSQESISKNENAKLFDVKQAEAVKAKLTEAKRTLEGLAADLSAAQEAMKPGASYEDYSRASEDLPALQKAVAAQEKEVAKLQKEWESSDTKVKKYDRAIQQATADIERNKARAAELSAQLNPNTAKMHEAFDKAHNSAQRFGKRLWEIGKSALIFNVISSGLRVLVQYTNKALKTNSEYTAQLAKLKGALLTAFQPIYEFVLPGLIAVLKILTAIVQVVANVLSALTGKTAAQSAKNAEALNEEAEAIGAVGSAAKESKKHLAGFDEINSLGSPDIGGGGGGSANGVAPDFSGFDTSEYKDRIDELTVYMSGALLALGAILAFSGANIPLGIGLMAAGAVGLASVAKTNWNSMTAPVKKALTKVSGVLGGAALAIGAILAFSGAKIPLGIGLMAVGAASLAGAAALNWNYLTDNVEGVIATIELLMGSAVLAIGAILALSGANLPLGIAMMATGAYAIHEAADLNWNSLSRTLQGPIGAITAVASAALLALGVILAFSGVATPLGIALIAAGAVGLVTTAAVNWSSIETTLKGPVGKVVAIASGALLALGVILAFSGINLPVGIALIAAGAAGLVTVGAINWNAILEKLKGAWEGIKQWFNTNVKPKLTLGYWKEKFSNIAEGLKQKLKDAINGGIALFNQFASWVNQRMKITWNDVTLFGQKIIPAGNIQLLRLPSIPYLAQGAVLPANKPFMAVVGDQKNGTNVEAPLETIKQALAEVMAMYGTGDTVIRFEGDLAQFIRMLKPYIVKEDHRSGGSLATEVIA